jgi:hypothetical protein
MQSCLFGRDDGVETPTRQWMLIIPTIKRFVAQAAAYDPDTGPSCGGDASGEAAAVRHPYVWSNDQRLSDLDLELFGSGALCARGSVAPRVDVMLTAPTSCRHGSRSTPFGAEPLPGRRGGVFHLASTQFVNKSTSDKNRGAGACVL